MPPCNIYSDDKPDVAGLSCLRFCFFGFGLLNFEFKWVLCWEIFIWNSVLFELRLCFYWHFHWYWVHNHEMTFRAQGKIHFHFHYYVWIYHFDNFSRILPTSPLLGFKYFKTNPNTDNNTDTKRDKKCHFRRLLFTLEWVDQYQLWRLRGLAASISIISIDCSAAPELQTQLQSPNSCTWFLWDTSYDTRQDQGSPNCGILQSRIVHSRLENG